MRRALSLACLLLASCGPKAGSTAPTFLDIGPGAPKLCLPSLPAAGPLRKEAETWTLATEALQAGDPAAAHEVLVAETQHPALDALRGIVRITAQDGEGAWALLLPLADTYEDDPCLDQVAALAAMQAGEAEVALVLADRAVRGAPEDVDIGLTRALFLLQQGQRDEARAALEAMAARQPDHVGLAFTLGVMSLEEGNLEAAVPWFEAAEAGGMPLGEDLVRMYFLAGRRADYLRRASEFLWPLGDEQAIAAAEDPEAAYREHLGYAEGQALHAVFVTPQGEIDCRLLPEEAPVTVANFVGLARGTHPFVDPESGEVSTGPFYDGTVFHRVIPEFMIQGGDPTGEGSGGPGYQFADEISPELRFEGPGVLAMANHGPDTNGSQFFITDGPADWLAGSHTIFGQCDAAGQEVVAAIADLERGELDRPVDDVVLETVRIEVR